MTEGGEREVLDRVSYSLTEACERFEMPRRLLRWRIYVDMTPHYAGQRGSVLLVRAQEIALWYRAAIRARLAGAPQTEWPTWEIVDPVTDAPVYSFISCGLKDAAARTGVSETTLHNAIADGYLLAHRAGDMGGKIVLRAADLDAWVQSLPTESPAERRRYR